jgi:hypothetical protein
VHERYIKGAIMARADVLIMSAEIREGKWEYREQELRTKYNLKIMKPEEYVDRNK